MIAQVRPDADQPVGPPRTRSAFNIVALAVAHPAAVLAFYSAVVLLALVAIFGGFMPRRMMPYVESPLIGIVTDARGMPAREVETYISMPIEQSMTTIRGVRYIRSSSQDGLSIVSLEFPYGSDMQRAASDIQARMNSVAGLLPRSGANLTPSWVLPIDPLNVPVLSLCVTGSPGLGWTPIAVRQFAANDVVAALKDVPDVQSVDVYGGEQRQLRVVVDRDKLAAYDLSMLDVRRAIDGNSVAASAGTLTSGASERLVQVSNLAQDASAVAQYPLRAPGGRVVTVGAVARVVDGAREQRSGYEYARGGKAPSIEGAGNDAVEVNVIQDPAAGSPAVVAAVLASVRQLERRFPGIQFQVAYDNAHFVDILFRNMGLELMSAVALCGLVVLLFLGDWRGALISLISIPVSLAFAVLLMAPFGFSLNSSTLIGLLIAIGRLVDDSVVDIHAVHRHLRLGKTVARATVDGITEVARPVAASTFMLVLALLPLVFSGGITQLMFVELAYPIIFGLIASFIVSLTLTAVLSSRLLRLDVERPHHWPGRLASRVGQSFSRRLDRMDERYRRWVLRLLDNKTTVIVAALCTVAIGVGFYNFIGSEMMPLADVGQAYGVLEMRPGDSFAATEAATTKLMRILLKQPEVEKVSTDIGEEGGGTYFTGYAMNQVNTATMMITLSDKDRRRRTVWQVIHSVRREALATIPGIRRLQIKEMGSDVMASSEAPITILVTGPRLGVLSRVADQVAGVARRTPGAHEVGTTWAVDRPEYDLDVDAPLAAQIGLSPAAVAEQAYYAMGGGLATEFYHLPDIRQDTIDVRYEADQRSSVADLLQMPIVGRVDGKPVETPLKTIATVRRVMGPSLIEHDGLQRSISVLAYYRKGGPPSMDLAMAIMTRASAQVDFPPGYSMQMRGDMTQMMDSFRRLLRGLELALLLIFIVLVAQFGSVLAPLQMVLSIPLELSGVFAGLCLAHQSFSTVSIMAVIVLSGMDITTAILLVDQILRRRREDPNMPRNQAIALACRDRLRPILMTSLITILTMLPVAVAPRTGMDAYQPLGTVIVAGLAVGTALSLAVIPVMHAIVNDLGRAAGARMRSRGAQAAEDSAP